MTSEEFEEMFGDVPFGTMIIIRDWVNEHYVSKDKIRDKIENYKILAEKSSTRETLYIYKNIIYVLERLLGD